MQSQDLDDIALARAVLNGIREGVCLVRAGRQIAYWNAGAERLTGYRAEEVMGRYCYDDILAHTDMDGRLLCYDGCPALDVQELGCTRTLETYLRHRDGHRVPVSVRLSPVRDERGAPIGVLHIMADNSAAVAAQARADQLEQLAMVDPLTQLANRRYLERAVRANLAELERYDRGTGVLLVDIDHFKAVNDRHGHAAGDEVLQMVARTLCNGLRPFDMVGRWGGEEFLVAVVNVDSADLLVRVGERLRRLVQYSCLQAPLHGLRVTVSLGAALARKGDTVSLLVARADRKLYEAKSRGRNQVSV